MTVTQSSYSTDLTAGLSGDPGSHNHDVFAMSSEESSAEIPFGTAVKRGSTDPERGALQPTAESDEIVGFVMRSHAYHDDELGDTGVKPGGTLNVMVRGLMWVQCDSGCTAGDKLWVRAVATGSERLGAPEDADDGTDTVDCTNQGTWMTTASAGELALLRFDFLGDAT